MASFAFAEDKHVVVVGAGIIGMSIAFHLVEEGARVTLLDASEPGAGASDVSFAWINGRDKNPRHYHDLNRRSLDMWERFGRRLGSDIGLTWGGELRWAATQDAVPAFAGRVNTLQSWGYPIHLLDAQALHRLEPEMQFCAVAIASFTRIDGHVNTRKVVAICIDQLRAQGAAIHANCAVTGLRMAENRSHGSQISAVRTVNGEFLADAVVLAGGADTLRLAAMAGLDVPMYHTFGATIVTEAVAPVFRNAAVIHTPREHEPQLNIRQFEDGSVMVHGGSHGGPHDGSIGRTAADVDSILHAAATYIPALTGVGIKEVRRGRRPIPQDGLPIIGYADSLPNLYLAVMHSGVTLAPLVGEFAAMEIMHNCRIDLLEPYRLERFGDRIGT